MNRKPHLGFSDQEKRKMHSKVKEVLAACDEPMEDVKIRFVGLAKDEYSHDALCIETKDVSKICEYPLIDGDLKPNLHEDVFAFIRERLWRQLRKTCLKLDGTLPHQDATWNTIWNERMVRAYPKAQKGMFAIEGRLKIEAVYGTNGQMQVKDDEIVLDANLPHSVITGVKRLGDIVDVPECGDNDVQQAFVNQLVFSITKIGDTTYLKTSVMVHPVLGTKGIYPWREMRRMERECSVYPASIDPISYDQVRDIERFLEENASFFAENGMPEDWYARKKAA